MPSLALPWASRWFHLSLALSLAATVFLLSAGVVAAQAFPPEATSEQGNDIRELYLVVFGVAAAIFILVEAAIIYLVVRYRRRNDELPPQIHGNRVAEILWTAVPTVIVVVLFALSFVVLEDVESAPDADEPVEVIDVLGQQWSWAFNYSAPLDATTAAPLSRDPAETTLQVSDGGAFRPFMTVRIDVEHLRVQEINGDTLTVERRIDGTVAQAHKARAPIDRIFQVSDTVEERRLEGAERTPVVTVPVGRTVRFNLASQDVIHSFYIPQFLYKLDAMPGRVQSLWVKVTEPGFYQGQCAEFCGLNHARMIFAVEALALAEYEEWLRSKTPELGAAAAAPTAATGEEPAAAPAAGGAPAGGDPARGGRPRPRPAALLRKRLQRLPRRSGTGSDWADDRADGAEPGRGDQSQYRDPVGTTMPPFSEGEVPDVDVADIYAWLQTVDLPEEIVPGRGTSP